MNYIISSPQDRDREASSHLLGLSNFPQLSPPLSILCELLEFLPSFLERGGMF